MKDCEMCNGKGYIPYRDPSLKPVYGRNECGICKGKGKIEEKKEPRFRKVYE